VVYPSNQSYRLTDVPYPSADAPLTAINLRERLADVNYWDAWDFWPSSPGNWLWWENYDP